MDLKRSVYELSAEVGNSTVHASGHGKEGGILNGVGPLDTGILLLLIYIMLIQLLVRIIAVPMKLIKQPQVIAEILAGIVLGPTVLGKIPGFSSTLFPPQGLVILDLFSNFGLILFLFIMGLELDLKLLRKQIKQTSAIAFGGMLVPFALAMPVGYFMYDQFINNNATKIIIITINESDPSLNITTTKDVPLFSFLLFIGVAACITAFPVLARILAELQLLSTKLGVTVLGAAAVNDAVAWILLALVIAIANAGNPANIAYIFLLLLAFCILMALLKFPLAWVLKKPIMRDKNNEISIMAVSLCLMMCMAASWYTSFIGVHAIFGAFICGLIIPRDNHMSLQIIEKIEDIVMVIFLPLYFAFSGLRTDLTTLNNGLAWAAVFLITFAVSLGKIGTSFIIARLTGIKTWREALALGIFMNCKGLVELIILNVGLDSQILNTTVFSIMVLLAIITTFMTSPLALIVYPKSKHVHVEIVEDETELHHILESDIRPLICALSTSHMPLLLGITQLLIQTQHAMPSFHVFRLLEITSRQSSVVNAMLANEKKGLSDQIGLALNKFSKMHNVQCIRHFKSSSLSELAYNINEVSIDNHLNLVIVPYIDFDFDLEDFSWRSAEHSLMELFETSLCDVCLVIDHGATVLSNRMNILIIFEEGIESSRIAMKFVFKVLKSPSVTATVLHKTRAISDEEKPNYEASRYSVSKFQESQRHISTIFDKSPLKKMVGESEKNVEIIKDISAIENVENLLLNNCTDEELIASLQQISSQDVYLQYYPIPENIVDVNFFENQTYPFSLVVSGRPVSKDESNHEQTLQELVGKTGFDLLASRVGCGQLVFSAKAKLRAHPDEPRTGITSFLGSEGGSIQERVLGGSRKKSHNHDQSETKRRTSWDTDGPADKSMSVKSQKSQILSSDQQEDNMQMDEKFAHVSPTQSLEEQAQPKKTKTNVI